MKRILLSTVVLLAFAGGSARAQDHSFDDVPLESWIYPAAGKINELGRFAVVKPPPSNGHHVFPLVRYEFAVDLAQWADTYSFEGKDENFVDSFLEYMKHHEIAENPAQELKMKDLVTALFYEFRPEFNKVRGRLSDINARQ